MEEEKPKKKRKKKGAAESEGEHKKNWREVYATVEDIKDFLGGRLFLRYNVITGRVECKLPSNYETDGTDWQPVSDRIVNTLWAELSKEKSTRAQDIYRVIESDFAPDYHPFRYYLEHLPPWNGTDDYILELSLSVSVKGDADEQLLFAEYLKKWLVGTFCATGNNVQFLSDPTGNRRWLPFEVENIDPPQEHPFNYEGIYSQAYALYQQGFRYWFSREEILRLALHNQQFETPRLEYELASLYFRQPRGTEPGVFMSVARAMQVVSANISQKLSAVYLGRAMGELGFRRVKHNGVRGYIVVCRSGDEMHAAQQSMAIQATVEEGSVDSSGQYF